MTLVIATNLLSFIPWFRPTCTGTGKYEGNRGYLLNINDYFYRGYVLKTESQALAVDGQALDGLRV